MRRVLVLTFAAVAVAMPAARGQTFLNRPAGDWLKDLNDPSAEVRRGAAFALGQIGAQADTSSIVDALTHRLNDPDAGVKDFAASGLGDVITALAGRGATYWGQTGAALRQALKDPDDRVRRSAAVGLGAFGSTAGPARDDLIAALGDPSPLVRQNAAWALGKIGAEAGPDAVDRLRGLLSDDKPLVRRDAMHALGEIGNPTVQPALSAMMKAAGGEKDAVVRKAAVEALSKLVGPDDDDSQKARVQAREDARSLYPLLQDHDPETRYGAAVVLGTIGGPQAAEALPALRDALNDPDLHFQEQAAAALGGLGKDAAPAVEDLGRALTTAKEPDARRNAAIALGKIGPDSKGALPDLIRALRYADSPPDSQYNEVRPYVAEALHRISFPGVEPAIPAVLEVIRSDPEPEVRHRCISALFDVRDINRYKITPVLTALLDETGPDTLLMRYDAARVLALRLGNQAPDKTTDVLLDMLTNPGLTEFRGTKTQTSGIGSEGAAGRTEVTADKSGDARWMAAQALGWLGRKANRPEVVKALQDAAQDKNEDLRKYATEALRSIK